MLAGNSLVSEADSTGERQIEAASAVNISDKPRLIVLTDIGSSDPDDEQSMIRLLSYANEFSIEGLVAGSNLEGKEQSGEQLIFDIVDQYALVHGNLLLHDTDYPTAAELRSKIVRGQPVGESFGDALDTAGSSLIIDAVDAPDPRPVNIAIWGGAADLAQALWRVRTERSEAETAAFVAKLRVAWIEQDSVDQWVKSNFPDLWIASHLAVDNGYYEAPFRGMYLGGDTSLSNRTWVNEKVKAHRPWGDLYPEVAAGGAMKEGDTPTWFYFLPSGLSDPDHPEWGGWGGRFDATGPVHSPAQDVGSDGAFGRNTVNRWRLDFQNDFEARMDWTVNSYADANHNPIAVIDKVNRINVVSGQTLTIDASQSHDPDGDGLSFEWFQYVEAGSYPQKVELSAANSPTVRLHAPEVSAPETVHIVLRVRDDGGPNLVSYQRVVLTVRPGSVSDLDDNGQVGFGDFLVFSTNYGRTDADSNEGDLDGDRLVAFSDFLIFLSEPEFSFNDGSSGPPSPGSARNQTPFTRFLALSAYFGSEAEDFDLDRDGLIGFADFLILAAQF